MGLQQRVVRQAVEDLGVREVPLGSNTGPRVREMQANTWLAGTGWPWCAAAVCTWYEEAGRALPFPTAGAWDMGNRGRAAGWVTSRPVAGDIVTFSFGAGHVAIFLGFVNGQVRSIDGNADHMVKECRRPSSQVREYVHVPDDDEPALPVPPALTKPPVFQVVRGQGEKTRVIYTGNWKGATASARRLLAKGATAVRIRKRRPKP